MNHVIAMKSWVESAASILNVRENGLRISEHGYGSVSVDLDSEDKVCTITSWPGGIYEIQINEYKTGELVSLATLEESDASFLTDYLREFGFIRDAT